MNRTLIALLAFALPTAALAAPPAGHPTPQDAGQILGIQQAQTPGEALPYKGTVVETFDANAYTYVLLKDGTQQRWLAAPRTEVKPGMVLRYGPGAEMQNFYSKVLNRTFERIWFVGVVRPE
ncbi:hypothetical protein [Azospirillum sp. sgz301742]